jgi:hypothetical protein
MMIMKGEIRILDIIVALFIISGLVIGITAYMGDMFNIYGKDDDVSSLQSISQMSGLRNKTANITALVGNANEGGGVDWGNFVGSIMRVGNYLFFLPKIAANMLTEGMSKIPLPIWFYDMLLGILTTVVLFVIISFIFDRRT